MTSVAILLILISAGFHAGWNIISKSGKPSPLFFLILTFFIIIMRIPFLIIDFAGIETLPLKFWYLLLATGFFRTLYYTGLANAYRLGEISLIYPLIRAIPVLLVPIVSYILNLGAPLSTKALTGMSLIGVGCLFMPVKSFRTWHIRDYWGPALFWVIPGALGTVGYTIIDSEAIKLLHVNSFSMPVSLIYSGFINLAIIPWLIPVVTMSKNWPDLKDYRGKKLLAPFVASITLSLSYMLILASMKFVDNVSYVVGFRQLSIPLGVFLGIVVLKEKVFLPRIIGSLIIAVGLMMTALF
jgi:uncharacterized membrane protein